MDSANSANLQSSSDGGDDQEHDSRADSISSSFFHPPPPHPHHYNHHNSASSPLSFDPNSLLNFDPIYTAPHPPPPLIPSQHHPGNNTVTNTTTTTTTTGQTAYNHHGLQPRPNPKKKRSRASRRAPTTVLTTDPTNFRAMVQEFTGIPAPPFSSSSSLSSSSPFTRSSPLDLFSTPSSIRSNPFLLRPFAQKLQPPLLPGGNSTFHMQQQNSVQSVGLDGFGPGHGLQHREENMFGVGGGNERISVRWGGAGVGPDSGDQSQVTLVNGSYDYSHGSGENGSGNLVNFAASSSGFNGGNKVAEKICGRGEGNVEPWICSLDQ